MIHEYTCSKLIISGEYSALFGSPAIIAAIDIYNSIIITEENSKEITFALINLSYNESISANELQDLRNDILLRYKNFLMNKDTIKNVLLCLSDLAKFTVANFLHFYNLKINTGFTIKIDSAIPINSGLGSSAAVIVSILKALYNFFQIKVHFEEIFTLAKEAENLQHGYSSGIDLAPIIYHSSIYYCENKFTPINLPPMSLYIINTGKPKSTTGESVNFVKKYFSKSAIWQDFENVTKKIYTAIKNCQIDDIKNLINANHLLLKEIGVIPKVTEKFINSLHFHNIAAKISGAGSVKGNTAGIVIALTDNLAKLLDICKNYNYKVLPVHLL